MRGHGVPLLETLPFLPTDPAAGPHAAAMAPSLLAKVMQRLGSHGHAMKIITGYFMGISWNIVIDYMALKAVSRSIGWMVNGCLMDD